jgi:hypothetical protein
MDCCLVVKTMRRQAVMSIKNTRTWSGVCERVWRSGVNLDFISFNFRIAVTATPNASPCTFGLFNLFKRYGQALGSQCDD